MRRTLILACLVITSAVAADHLEVITLSDGRSFTGTYDDEAQVLHTSTPAGKAFDLRVAPEAIADRAAAKKAAAVVAAPKRAEPAPMTAEQKAAANRDFAYQQKVREADALDADAAKAQRDAAEARKMAQRQTDHARNDWRAFCRRAADEGILLSPEGPISETLIVLPRTKGNNRASMEGLALSKQQVAKAAEYDALAGRKVSEASAARAAAEQLPHGAAAVAAAPVVVPAVAAAAAPALQLATSQLVRMWEDDKARLTTPDRDAKWLGCAPMPPVTDTAGAGATAINAAVASFNAALSAHDAAAMVKVMESETNRALFAAYEAAIVAHR